MVKRGGNISIGIDQVIVLKRMKNDLVTDIDMTNTVLG
jgi:hypothetical protein